jgi:hypothetical protein
MTEAARTVYAGLHLLDHQIVDRAGRMAGNVDDLEVAFSEDTGQLYVTAILSGAGALARRMNRRRLGRWLERVSAFAVPTSDVAPAGRIPFSHVASLDGSHVTVAFDREDLVTHGGERWVLDHLIGHIPGSGHAPE